ncbi:rCG41624 [Rattus norvegicus]|uniref:RCG41624 n=1 Tax=Rattus norvegicus TaxID=10116 RepID=A6IH35_RAT|nr:rCG41624 [Rattus norvegicus]
MKVRSLGSYNNILFLIFFFIMMNLPNTHGKEKK